MDARLLIQIWQQFHSMGLITQGRPLRLRATLRKWKGSVTVPNLKSYCYARIHGTPASSLHLVLNTVGVPALDGLEVLIERESGVGGFTTQYRVVEVWSGLPEYDPEPLTPGVTLHAPTHWRQDWGVYGPDPLDVFKRMLVEGRVDATDPASMSVHIAAIDFRWGVELNTFPETTTSALTVTSPLPQMVLIYFVPETNTYGIRYGTPAWSPEEPDVEAGEAPLAIVLLTPDTTAILDTRIKDRRDFLSLVANAFLSHAEDHVARHGHGGADELIHIGAAPPGVTFPGRMWVDTS